MTNCSNCRRARKTSIYINGKYYETAYECRVNRGHYVVKEKLYNSCGRWQPFIKTFDSFKQKDVVLNRAERRKAGY